MGLLSLSLVLALAATLGAATLAATRGPSASGRVDPALALVAGLVGHHVLLLLYDLVGLAWRREQLLFGWILAVVIAAGVALRRRGGERPSPGTGPGRRVGVGDAVAALAVLAYAGAAWTRRITIPDFIYHWGLKAKRSLVAGGVDYAFLTDPLRLTDHPDYPSLVPGLYASIGLVRGAFHERAALVASAAFFAVAVVATRRAVTVAGLSRPAGQGTVALVALVLASFGIGYRMAGAADWPVVAALLLALPALLAAPPAPGSTVNGDPLRLGLAAALAAGAKIEGVPLAALLVAAGLARWAPVAGRSGPRREVLGDLARLLVPPLLVVTPWLIQNLRHGLFAAENSGPLVASRVPQMARAAVEAMAIPEWYGLPWILLLLPLAVVVRATRPAATVLLLQAGFYAWVYLTSPVDTRFLVLSSLPRLLFHLLPPLLVLLAVVLFGPRRPGASAAGQSPDPPPEEEDEDDEDDEPEPAVVD